MTTLLSISIIGGCGSETAPSEPAAQTRETAQEEPAVEPAAEEEDKEDAAPTEAESAEETEEAAVSADDILKAYDALLAGDAKVIVSSDAERNPDGFMSFHDSIPDGTECSLDDINDAFRKSVCARMEISEEDLADYDFTIDHAIIDCGCDDIPELLVVSQFPFFMDGYSAFMVIKGDPDQLTLGYLDVVNSRSSLIVNEYGYVEKEASGGASFHEYEYGYLDSEADWKFLYGAELDSDLVEMGIYADDNSYEIPENVAEDFEKVAFLKFYFEDSDEESRQYTNSYSVMGEYDSEDEEPYSYSLLNRDAEIYAADSVYMKTFDDLGISVVPLADMDAKILDIESSAGIDDQIKQGKVALQFIGE